MFNKLLIKALKKRFNKFSPDEKQNVREMVNNETISDTTEKQKVKKRRKKTMADEKEVKDKVEPSKVETENNEVEKEKSTEKVEKTDGDTKETVETTETKTEKTETPKDDPTNDVEPTEQVQDTPPTGNGIRVDELVTKDMLAERLAAFEAKFNAVVKENEDLKNQLSAKSEELDGMKDKYENKDFGNFQKQGVPTKDKSANSSFEEYSKQFM